MTSITKAEENSLTFVFAERETKDPKSVSRRLNDYHSEQSNLLKDLENETQEDNISTGKGLQRKLTRQFSTEVKPIVERSHHVRIPIYFSSLNRQAEYLHTRSYMYFFSPHPQVYWIKKCTFIYL
jgi:hypothetical protein